MQFSIPFLMTAVVAVQAANNVKQKIVYTAAGATAVVGDLVAPIVSSDPIEI
jgi:hypothetical protein